MVGATVVVLGMEALRRHGADWEAECHGTARCRIHRGTAVDFRLRRGLLPRQHRLQRQVQAARADGSVGGLAGAEAELKFRGPEGHFTSRLNR